MTASCPGANWTLQWSCCQYAHLGTATRKRAGSAARNRVAPPSVIVMSRLAYSTHSGSSGIPVSGGATPSPNLCTVHDFANGGAKYGRNGPLNWVVAAPAAAGRPVTTVSNAAAMASAPRRPPATCTPTFDRACRSRAVRDFGTDAGSGWVRNSRSAVPDDVTVNQ